MVSLYTFFTPSHQILFDDWLKPTAVSCGFEIRVRTHSKQFCLSASYADVGWRETQIKKLANWIAILKSHSLEDIIVASDADVQIIKPCAAQLIQFLGNNDLSFQENVDEKVCSGFFVARCNDKVVDFFTRALKSLTVELVKSAKGGGEQYEIWKLIESGNHHASVGMLPKDEIWNPRQTYKNLNELDIPTNMMVHHANWTEGMDNKIKQLEYVRDVFK